MTTTTATIETQLTEARTESARLREEVTKAEQALQAAQDAAKSAVSRGAFEKSSGEVDWCQHLLELASKRAADHEKEVLAVFEQQRDAEQRAREEAIVRASCENVERAVTKAGERLRDMRAALSGTINALAEFNATRMANPKGAGAVSLARLRMASVIAELNAALGEPAVQFAVRYQDMDAGGGELQVQLKFPVRVPQELR